MAGAAIATVSTRLPSTTLQPRLPTPPSPEWPAPEWTDIPCILFSAIGCPDPNSRSCAQALAPTIRPGTNFGHPLFPEGGAPRRK
ncbi:hypothetical protein Sp245p_32315 (plasmid) [Azospirillum baldaniorum]|uniref:Uncharacterized protein n=1 Tax=Azospirillum baldaniorum TaxID=1064539 RepID=A0A9P1K131_9PROT|nr:hypothetical protein Sp245p_32315 [Azospirillum baldaniorum]CCD03595.1 protein of unknown function [Azospirillum baldaniorum]